MRKILESQKQKPGPTLFLGNLGFETDREGIRDFLAVRIRARGRGAEKKSTEGEEGDEGDEGEVQNTHQQAHTVQWYCTQCRSSRQDG